MKETKREFANDPMMSELHAIREKHYQQTKSAPATERNRLVSFLSSYGYRLVPTKRGTRKLVEIPVLILPVKSEPARRAPSS